MGSMEGKEVRFGIAQSALFTTVTTSFTTGTVNNMHDTLTPLGGMVPLLHMMLNCVFGGKGVGLMNMIMYAILAVFICGLMIGRTPEYLGKKIEPFEMKMACVVCLATPVAILIGSGIAAVLPQVLYSLNNTGAHGLSEILYAYSSAGGNNGSAFAGFAADTPFLNLSLGMIMALVRFVPMMAVLAIAGSLARKKHKVKPSGNSLVCERMSKK